ncbi:MAG TPA: hypothetical protein VGV86_12795 [Acidimicrobiales bacterium]|nr:hypothetical protein [Acidimicrobiales bacterium]
MVHRRTTLAVAMVAVMLMVGCGDDEESSAPDTTVAPTTTLSQIQLDDQKAQRVVLTEADLAGYTVDPPDPDDEITPEDLAALNACGNNDPLFVQLDKDDDPRGATSPSFSKGDTITAGSSVTFGENEDQAKATMTAVSAASFPTCLSRALTAQLRRNPGFTNVTVSTTKLPALTAGDQAIGYRNTARFRAGGTAVTFYADTVFIRSGRAVASVDVSSVGTPFPEAERTRLATTLAGRMAAP